jgi:hypothetical protein
VFVDFWGWTSDPSGEKGYLTSFLLGLGNTTWLSTVDQYGAGSTGQLLGGTWSDPATVPASPTDAQIQAEAVNAANHFSTGNSVNVQIVVATPTGHSSAGFGSTFCAYHGAVAADPSITYTNLPYQTDEGSACGEDSVNGAAGLLDGVSIVEGHELAEAATDPLLNAWLDSAGNEIGDKCAWTDLADMTTAWGTFAVQPLWSNAAGGCVVGAVGWTVAPSGVIKDADGRLEAFGVGPDGNLGHSYETQANGTWTAWTDLGPKVEGAPAVGRNADGRLEVFAAGTDGKLGHMYQLVANGLTGWSSWVPDLGAKLTGTPTVASNADGRLEVFAKGPGGVLGHIYQLVANGGWSGWLALGVSPKGSPAVGHNADGRLVLFAIGKDGKLGSMDQLVANGLTGWSSWADLGPATTGIPAVAANADGRLEVFAKGPGGVLGHIYQLTASGSWSQWTGLGVKTRTVPAAGLDAEGRLEVFATGPHSLFGHIYQTVPNGLSGWSKWTDFGPATTGTTAVGADANGALEVIAPGPGGVLGHMYQSLPNDNWFAWTSM